jgi:uncharacterized protein YkwD
MRSVSFVFGARLWSRSAVSAILTASLLLVPAAAQATDLAPLRLLALELVNRSRTKHDLPPLRLEAKLTEAAQSHAADMLKRGYYSHTSPEGKSVGDRFQAAGGSRWVLTAENIAKCEGCAPPLDKDYVRKLHEGWMKSPGHRANILRKGLDSFGYGIVLSKSGGLYAVQTFAGPGTPRGTGPAADETPLSASGQAQAALNRINEARKAAGRAPLKLSKPLSAAARKLAPAPGKGDFSVEEDVDIYGALPRAERGNWRTLTVVSASCGGCGVAPVAADVAFFAEQWLEQGSYKQILLSKDITHLGFAMTANGEGKKVAVALVGKHR